MKLKNNRIKKPLGISMNDKPKKTAPKNILTPVRINVGNFFMKFISLKTRSPIKKEVTK